MDVVEDRDLLLAVADGDSVAFASLYDRHAETVARYLWAWVEDRDEVQDLVQETFMTAWQKALDVRVVDASALPWLLVTAKNHARNRQRKVARRRETTLGPWAEHLTDEAGQADGEKLRWVRDEIAGLGELDRLICQMCLEDGVPYKEAAATLGQSVATVGKRLQRAKARIRKAALTHD